MSDGSNEPRRVMRIKRRRDFLAAQRQGRKQAMPGMVVQARARRAGETTDDAPRIGFTCSRKVGNAVARNRARRRLRAAVDEIVKRGQGPKHGYDVVVIGRQATLVRNYAKLLGDLDTALSRLNAGGGS